MNGLDGVKPMAFVLTRDMAQSIAFAICSTGRSTQRPAFRPRTTDRRRLYVAVGGRSYFLHVLTITACSATIAPLAIDRPILLEANPRRTL